jgi:flavin reductase (DIM6/NTAB) family NADH-FMN oxidoreductase RutF/DNA-binding MarR family transcriptional regulator
MTQVDGDKFRNALGHFATGVTVVTTLDQNGEPLGITANSFNSVSLDPPMVLWSIAKESGKRSTFEGSDHFVVNVLAEDQVEVSQHFAKSAKDMFSRIEWQPGLNGLPLLPACAARFQCSKVYQYDGGDHIIIVGKVDQFDDTGREALVFHRGRYAVVDVHPDADSNAPGGFEDDFLMALLMRATYEFVEPFKERISSLDLNEAEVRVLTFLSGHDGCKLNKLTYGTMLSNSDIESAVESLIEKKLARRGPDEPDIIRITTDGRDKVVPVMAIAKAHETNVLADYTPEQVFKLKRELRRLADRSRS